MCVCVCVLALQLTHVTCFQQQNLNSPVVNGPSFESAVTAEATSASAAAPVGGAAGATGATESRFFHTLSTLTLALRPVALQSGITLCLPGLLRNAIVTVFAHCETAVCHSFVRKHTDKNADASKVSVSIFGRMNKTMNLRLSLFSTSTLCH